MAEQSLNFIFSQSKSVTATMMMIMMTMTMTQLTRWRSAAVVQPLHQVEAYVE